MYAIATCLATIYRNVGNQVDSRGDPVPASTVIATNVPCGIYLKSTTVSSSTTIQDEATKTPRSIRQFEAVMFRPTDIRSDDILYDQKNALYYTVLSVTREEGMGYSPDVTVELKRVN